MAIRCSRIRPSDPLISSSVPGPRWQQALSPDCGFDLFGSAYFTRSFTPENIAHKFGSALTVQHGILRPARGSLPGSPFALLCSLINRFSKCLFDRMYQVANTKVVSVS